MALCGPYQPYFPMILWSSHDYTSGASLNLPIEFLWGSLPHLQVWWALVWELLVSKLLGVFDWMGNLAVCLPFSTRAPSILPLMLVSCVYLLFTWCWYTTGQAAEHVHYAYTEVFASPWLYLQISRNNGAAVARFLWGRLPLPLPLSFPFCSFLLLVFLQMAWSLYASWSARKSTSLLGMIRSVKNISRVPAAVTNELRWKRVSNPRMG